EVVGRHPGDVAGLEILVEQEHARVGPDVGALVRDEDRHVAEQGDTPALRVAADPLPRAVGAALTLDDAVDFDRGLAAHRIERRRLAARVLRRPMPPWQAGKAP